MVNPFSFTQSRRALTAGFGALLVLIVVITLFGIWRIYAINRHVEALVQEQHVQSGMLTVLLTASQQRQQAMHQLFNAGAGAERTAAYRQYQAMVEPLFTTLARLDEMDMTSAERAAVKTAHDAAIHSRGWLRI